MKEKLVGNVIRERFHLVDTGHLQFIPVEQEDFSAWSQEKHALLAGILHFKVSDRILDGECKAAAASVQRIIIYQCMIPFLKPYLVIFIIEDHSGIFFGDGKRKFSELLVTDIVFITSFISGNIHQTGFCNQ